MTRKLIYKVYNEAGTFKGILNDVINDLSFLKTINGGLGQCIIRLNRKIDNYDQDNQIDFNNRVQVYLTDDYNTDELIYQGYITAYNPFLSESDEYVEITCLGAISKLKNDFFRSGTTLSMSEGGTEIGQVFKNIIDNYRGLEANSMISNDYSNVDNTSKNISYTYVKKKHLDAMKKTAEFLDYDWYWFLAADGLLKLAERTAGDHTFILKKTIKQLKVHKTIESVQNYFFFWNGLTADNANYLNKQYSDGSSQSDFDIIASQKTDGRITVEGTADELGDGTIAAHKDPKTRTTLIIGKEYDLASINPGDTCNIRNIDTSEQTTFADDLLIVRVNYTPDYAILELAEIKDDIKEVLNTPSESSVERIEELQDDINNVNEDITIQGWTQDMAFSSSDYRTVAWAGGTITLSNNDTYSIDGGNTGNMSALTYIYLSINDSITVLQTTTTPATAVGVGKILIAVAQNNTDTTSDATFQVFGGKGGVFLGVDNLAANSASVNEFVANTANIKNAIISSAKIVDLVADKITAGAGIIASLSVLSTLTMGDAGTDGIIQSFGWDGSVAGFQILGGGSPSVTLIGGTITGGTIQTDVDPNARIVLDNTPSLTLYDSSNRQRIFMLGSQINFKPETGDEYIVGASDALGLAFLNDGNGLMILDSDALYSGYSLDLGKTGSRWDNLFLAGEITMNNTKILGLGAPAAGTDAANKAYVDNLVFSCSDLSGCNLTSLGTRQHAGLTNVNVSDHHSSTSNNLTITPTRVDIADPAGTTGALNVNGNLHIYNGAVDIKTISAVIAWNGAAYLSATAATLVCEKYLVLETSSSDPTGVTGLIFFHTGTGSFRGYDGSNWKDLAWA